MLSLKFCMKKAERTIVAAGAAAWTSRSARCASSSPRPESSTIRRTPASRAAPASAATVSAAPGTAMSGA
jgi:hypothetical protein